MTGDLNDTSSLYPNQPAVAKRQPQLSAWADVFASVAQRRILT
jgi:hypothetical protein